MIPTAAEFLDQGNFNNTTDMMIEFAQMHVKAALEAADAQAEHLLPEGCWDLLEDVNFITESYPESNIK